MKLLKKNQTRRAHSGLLTTITQAIWLAFFTAAAGYAQSPWETAVKNLEQAFTGPIARGLSLVAIVIGGLTFAYSEGGSKKVFAGILFGIGMAMSAAAFLGWITGA